MYKDKLDRLNLSRIAMSLPSQGGLKTSLHYDENATF